MNWNRLVDKGLVNISANWSIDDMNCTDIWPALTCSPTKWKSTSTCFVRALKHGLTARYEAPMLSHQIIVGWWVGCLSSWRRERSQIISVLVLATDWYSASVYDRATVGCFLADQDIRFRPIYTAKPPVDLLSVWLPAQSASQKAWSWELVGGVINNPWCKVALSYRRTRFQAVQWVVVGADKNWHYLFTANAKSGRVRQAYYNAPTILL